MATSCLHLVDLAGCEQLKLSKATGSRKAEAAAINSSLSVLAKVRRRTHQYLVYIQGSNFVFGVNVRLSVVSPSLKDPTVVLQRSEQHIMARKFQY